MTAEASAELAESGLEGEQLVYEALYCTPHIRIPGELRLRPGLLAFDPDPAHPHVREFGIDQYAVNLEFADIFKCGAVVMPLEELEVDGVDGTAFNLQVHVKTLDGIRYCAQDLESAWSVVFRMHDRDELYQAARFILDSIDCSTPMPTSEPSHTTVPFCSVDCFVELEAKERNHRQRCLPQPSSPPHSRSFRGSIARLHAGELSKTLLTHRLADALLDYLPICLRFSEAVDWELRYSPKAHGVSMATLFRNLADQERTVLMVEDAEEHVFGGFGPVPWEPCNGRFYGSGEAFVFSFGKVGEQAEVKVYPWTYKNSCFMYSDHDLLAMGGGDGRHAIVVRDDLLHGNSSPTLTFGNPLLASSEEFVVRDLEIWALEEG